MQVASQLAFLDFATFILMGECSWVRMRRCSARTVAANSKPREIHAKGAWSSDRFLDMRFKRVSHRETPRRKSV